MMGIIASLVMTNILLAIIADKLDKLVKLNTPKESPILKRIKK
jgi:hypothetical protein